MPVTYPIEGQVKTTVDRMISFLMPELVKNPGANVGLAPTELCQVDQYKKYAILNCIIYNNNTFLIGQPSDSRR